MITETEWTKHQEFEREWHNCANSIGEKFKQFTYFIKMGVSWSVDIYDGSRIWLNVGNIKVCDIGGGPDSALLQTKNVKGTVIDPCKYSQWTRDRYAEAGIKLIQSKGEDIDTQDPEMKFDEVWIYNCLQHVENPDIIAKKALEISKLVRVFEPVDVPASPGHPHVLTESWLNSMFNGNGTVEDICENGFIARAYYGCFPGKL